MKTKFGCGDTRSAAKTGASGARTRARASSRVVMGTSRGEAGSTAEPSSGRAFKKEPRTARRAQGYAPPAGTHPPYKAKKDVQGTAALPRAGHARTGNDSGNTEA